MQQGVIGKGLKPGARLPRCLKTKGLHGGDGDGDESALGKFESRTQLLAVGVEVDLMADGATYEKSRHEMLTSFGKGTRLVLTDLESRLPSRDDASLIGR